MQEFITRMYVKQLLQHPAFQMLLTILLMVNAITIGLRTNSSISQVCPYPGLRPHCSDQRPGQGPARLGLRLLIGP